jgi:hypothetical protein
MCHNAFASSKSQDVLVYMGCTHQHINIWDWVALQMIALRQYQTWLAGISASACWTFPLLALPPYHLCITRNWNLPRFTDLWLNVNSVRWWFLIQGKQNWRWLFVRNNLWCGKQWLVGVMARQNCVLEEVHCHVRPGVVDSTP